MMAAEEKSILSTGEVAVMLGVSDDFVRRLCENGALDGDMSKGIEGCWRAGVGAQWRIPRKAVQWFLRGVRPLKRTTED